VVQGSYPPSDKSLYESLLPYQKFYAEEECQKTHERNLKKKNYKLNIGGTDERDLEEAIKNSLNEQSKQNDEMDTEDNKQQEDDKAFKPFQGKGIAFSSSKLPQELEEYFNMTDPSQDPELAEAIKFSISEKFAITLPEDDNSLSLNIRFPDGSSKSWIFPLQATVEDLYDYVKLNLPPGQYYKFKVGMSYPKQFFMDLKRYLLEVGISTKDSILVEKV